VRAKTHDVEDVKEYNRRTFPKTTRHKRAGRCYCLLRCLRAFVLFLRAFPFLWCGVLPQHFIPPQNFAVCVFFILRAYNSSRKIFFRLTWRAVGDAW
jgi:hypothetical protein